MFTEYCCRLVLGELWEETASVLDKIIASGSYDEGVMLIRNMDITLDKKERLERCLLSYKGSC